jgi:hypothetical protein
MTTASVRVGAPWSTKAVAAVQAMTATLRDDVDLARVEADVLGVIDRTFHPAKAGMWLR